MRSPLESGSFRPARPFHMVWLATNACNARCMHCSSASAFRTPDELSTVEVLDLLDQLADFGVVDLAISGGEPLLRQNLFEIIDYAVRRGFAVGVGSNGAARTHKRIRALAESGITRLQISLDGFRVPHDRLRRWDGLFDLAVGTIEAAVRAGVRTHVCCTINRLNVHELEEFASFLNSLGVRRLNLSRFVPTGRGSDTLDLSAPEWRSVIEVCMRIRQRFRGSMEVVSHLAQQILVDRDVECMPGFIGCQAGVGQGCVSANGTVWPCVLLPVPLGNIREQRFCDIWQFSPVLLRLRARENLKGACASCVVQDRCGGCRAVAFAKTGDYLATDPRCWLGNSSEVTLERRYNHV